MDTHDAVADWRECKVVRDDSVCTVGSLMEENTVIGLFYGARLCAACRDAMGKLAQCYNQLAVKNHLMLEIVFISSDKDEADFKEFTRTMPWYSVQYKGPARAVLQEAFKVSLMPTIIFLNACGDVLTRDGRVLVQSDSHTSFANTWPLLLKLDEEARELESFKVS
eukprot:TRINITY_DN2273_c2_g1_i1.p1 TRINITY_DN2273_c2_g1~~TRINITY_DN2273_c2_g1_i1.p1  ORF type:complete len:166 (+),score=27.41 TRINITY_DN2273_c2_g1_i1:13-510(+)